MPDHGFCYRTVGFLSCCIFRPKGPEREYLMQTLKGHVAINGVTATARLRHHGSRILNCMQFSWSYEGMIAVMSKIVDTMLIVHPVKRRAHHRLIPRRGCARTLRLLDT